MPACSARAATAANPDAVLRAILDEAQRLSAEGFDRALFDRLIRSSLGRRTRDLDSFESVCYRMCAYHFDGVDYFSFPEAYASVTPEDVLQFIRQVIRRSAPRSASFFPMKVRNPHEHLLNQSHQLPRARH